MVDSQEKLRCYVSVLKGDAFEDTKMVRNAKGKTKWGGAKIFMSDSFKQHDVTFA